MILGVVGELCVVCVAQLLGLWFMQAALKPAGGEKRRATFLKADTSWAGFSVAGCREAVHRSGVPDVAEFSSG
jgi:hypothetical protein